MIKKDKNGFLDVIRSRGLDPTQFKRHEKEVDGYRAFIVQLVNSPLFFMARTTNDDFREHDVRYINFGPGYTKSDYLPEFGWADIDYVYAVFSEWLERHVEPFIEENEETDLWEQIESDHLLTGDPLSNRDQRTFSKPEKEKVRIALQQFEALIVAEFSPSPTQLESIQDRLEYLSEGVDRLNRVDWQGIAITTVISISIALNLDTDQGKTLFGLFKRAFSAGVEYFG
ncbi:MAG: hypothetical protein WD356_01210 [Pseudomonadales bacterium]